MFRVTDSEIYIYDIIGKSDLGFIGADAILEALDSMNGKRVTVRINSPGGEVDEASSIYNMLRRHNGGVDVFIDSLAASAASFIAMAGETVTIAKNGMLMIHDPWTIAIGNAESMRRTADVLDKYGDRLIPMYQEKTGKTADEIRQIMAAETWYTASEALSEGFVDAIEGVSDAEPVAPSSLLPNKPEAIKDSEIEVGSRVVAPRRQYAQTMLRIMTAKFSKKLT